MEPQPNKNIQRYEHEPPEGEDFKVPIPQQAIKGKNVNNGGNGVAGKEVAKVERKEVKVEEREGVGGGARPQQLTHVKEGVGRRREGAQKEKVCSAQRISQKPGAPITMKMGAARHSGPGGTGKHVNSKNAQNNNLSIKSKSSVSFKNSDKKIVQSNF